MHAALGQYRHIAIEGPIGVGKSSLAARLARHLEAELLLELPAENPFLGRFYADMAGYAFQTQLFFLFQRLRQMQAVAQQSVFATALVSDFMLAKDAIFARLNLSDEEHRLYLQMYSQLAPQVREPDLVIWLQARPQTLLQRVRRRGIAMEQGMGLAYLERLSEAYAEHFGAYEAAPVFAVDTEDFHPAARDSDFAALLESLARFEGRRGYLDAGSQALLS